ncbi:MAG TPA: hypothetical protein VLD18_10110, partial [Verrucomicrobiae bacterium]|nr:hypothetical protein [Verrucomicrobiae bacterium]
MLEARPVIAKDAILRAAPCGAIGSEVHVENPICSQAARQSQGRELVILAKDRNASTTSGDPQFAVR